MVGSICSLHVALQQRSARLLSAYRGSHGCLISSKPARLRTDSRILSMIRRHIIRLQMLSIPFTTKQRWTDDTRASIDNCSPEASRVQRSGNQRNCSTDWNSSMTRMKPPSLRPCHGNGRGPRVGFGRMEFHAAATALCHCAAASARKVRSVDRETRWRCRSNVLWTAAWTLRKRWADRADLNRCILRSRRRTT